MFQELGSDRQASIERAEMSVTSCPEVSEVFPGSLAAGQKGE
jgi:hypothetical protein